MLIKPNKIDLVVGGDDVYRACTLLSRELWGSLTVRGSREFMLGIVAHGEENSVDLSAPNHSNQFAPFWRAFVFVCVVIVG